MILAELFQGNQIYSGYFNNAELFSIDVSFNKFYSNVAKSSQNLNSLLTCLCHMHFRGMTVVFLSYAYKCDVVSHP